MTSRRALGCVALVACVARALVACGHDAPPPASPPPAHGASTPAHGGAQTVVAANPDAGALASYDELTARLAAASPGLHEVTRVDLDAGASTTLTPDADTCLRIAFSAAPPSRVTLARSADASAADATVAKDGLLGPSGPICVGRGEAARVENAGPGRVRVVAWGSP